MFIRIAAMIFLLSLAGLPVQASADFHLLLVAANAISLNTAVKQVKQQTGGRVLTAETVTRKGNKVYRIKVLLPDGTVKVMYINAE
jgi:uncharacterized membrane protein YkoI